MQVPCDEKVYSRTILRNLFHVKMVMKNIGRIATPKYKTCTRLFICKARVVREDFSLNVHMPGAYRTPGTPSGSLSPPSHSGGQ